MGNFNIDIEEEDYNASRFAFNTFPCLLWNEQNKTFITKDFLSGKELETFAEHQILHLNMQVNDLSLNIRDFARSVVDQAHKKDKGWLTPKALAWAAFIILVILAIIFLPKLLPSLGAAGAGAASSIGSATSSVSGAANAIQPVG